MTPDLLDSASDRRAGLLHRWLVFACMVALGACDRSPRDGPLESGAPLNATIVQSDAPIWEDAGGLRVSSAPLLSIGVRDGDAEYQFFQVVAAARQLDGDVVVADRGFVRLYDARGVVKRTLGGPGSGPGEFRAPTQIRLRADDTIVVWDDVSYRMTVFDAEGGFVEALPVQRKEVAKAVAPPLYPASTLMLGGGALIVRLVEKKADFPTTSPFRPRSGALRVASGPGAVEPVMDFLGEEQVIVDSPWGRLPVAPPLAKRTSIAVQPNEPRLCVGEQKHPEVVCLEADGSAFVLRWPADALAVDRNAPELRAWRDRTVEEYSAKLTVEEVTQLVDQVPLPEVRPVYDELTLDRTGRLWVRHGPIVADGEALTEYWVFNRGGSLLGTVPVPPVRVLEIGEDYLLGVFEDGFEVQHVQLFAIENVAGTSE